MTGRRHLLAARRRTSHRFSELWRNSITHEKKYTHLETSEARRTRTNTETLMAQASRKYDPPRTRTWNLRLRRPTPYPLGQRAEQNAHHFHWISEQMTGRGVGSASHDMSAVQADWVGKA